MPCHLGDREYTSLFTTARIITESVLLYTIEMVILSILNFVDHPSQFIVRGAVIPTIGEFLDLLHLQYISVLMRC